MGLDGVELVITIEETFGFEIDNKDAEKLVIVGQMYDYICDRHKVQNSNTCATQKAFYLIRNSLSRFLSVDKKNISPKTRIREIIKNNSPKKIWGNLSEDTSLVLPKLIRPMWVISICFISCIVLTSLLTYLIIETTGVWNIGLLSFVLVLWILIYCSLFEQLTIPLRNLIPEKYQTVGDISREVVVLNAKSFEPLTKKEIWDILVNIISEQLGIEKDKIKPESHFVKDLGID